METDIVSVLQEADRHRNEDHEQSLDDRIHHLHITTADLEGKLVWLYQNSYIKWVCQWKGAIVMVQIPPK